MEDKTILDAFYRLCGSRLYLVLNGYDNSRLFEHIKKIFHKYKEDLSKKSGLSMQEIENIISEDLTDLVGEREKLK